MNVFGRDRRPLDLPSDLRIGERHPRTSTPTSPPYGVEHALGRGALRDQRCYAPERGLLVGHRPQPGARLGVRDRRGDELCEVAAAMLRVRAGSTVLADKTQSAIAPHMTALAHPEPIAARAASDVIPSSPVSRRARRARRRLQRRCPVAAVRGCSTPSRLLPGSSRPGGAPDPSRTPSVRSRSSNHAVDVLARRRPDLARDRGEQPFDWESRRPAWRRAAAQPAPRRGRSRLSRLGVCDRCRDELRELLQPLLRVGG